MRQIRAPRRGSRRQRHDRLPARQRRTLGKRTLSGCAFRFIPGSRPEPAIGRARGATRWAEARNDAVIVACYAISDCDAVTSTILFPWFNFDKGQHGWRVSNIPHFNPRLQPQVNFSLTCRGRRYSLHEQEYRGGQARGPWNGHSSPS